MKMKKGVIGVAAALAAILMVASGCSSSGGSTESGTDTTSTAVSATNQQSEGFEIKYPESLQEQFGESLKMEKTGTYYCYDSGSCYDFVRNGCGHGCYSKLLYY